MLSEIVQPLMVWLLCEPQLIPPPSLPAVFSEIVQPSMEGSLLSQPKIPPPRLAVLLEIVQSVMVGLLSRQ